MKPTTWLVVGALGWGVVTGVAVSDVAGLMRTGEAGVAGPQGEAGPTGKAGVDSTQVGPAGEVGPKGPTGYVGPRGPDYAPTEHVVFSRSGSGGYEGPTVPNRAGVEMVVSYGYSCGDGYYPYFTVSWQGVPRGYDYLWADGTSGQDVQYFHPDSDSGYFHIGSQGDCSWSVSVTQVY